MRNLVIEESRLKSLLESRKLYIGGSIISGIGLFTGGATSIHSGSLDDYIQMILGAILILAGLWQGYSSRKYNYKKLFKEITSMDKTAHHHSIVAIKDTFNDSPNHFLVYDDPGWKCRLFPNFPTQDTEEGNESFIKKRLASELKINEKDIHLEKKGEALQEKYSAKHKENRIYDHIFYLATISKFGTLLENPAFTIDNKSYHWMTIHEMENDPAIQEKNMEVLQEINRLIP